MQRKRKPKILFTTATISPQSGASKILLDMVRGISEQGYSTITVLSPNDQCLDLLLNVERNQAYFLPLPSLRRVRSIWYYIHFIFHNMDSILKIVRIIRSEHVDIVHINEIFDLYAIIAAKITKTPCLWNVRAELSAWPILNWFLPRIATQWADVVVVASESVRRHTFQGWGIKTSKVSILYDPGFDFAHFHPNVDGSKIRVEYSIKKSDHLVVFVAKLSKRKGHELLIRAAPEVLAKFPNTHFLIVGGELKGNHHKEYSKKLRSLVYTLNLEKRVIFTGYRSDVPQIMAAADIIVHSSTYPDPFPGVVLQGMAVGKPVIAPDLGGPKEQIEHNVSGILISPNSSDTLAKAICELLQGEEKRGLLGKAAVKRIESGFGFNQYYQKLSDIYKQLA